MQNRKQLLLLSTLFRGPSPSCENTTWEVMELHQAASMAGFNVAALDIRETAFDFDSDKRVVRILTSDGLELNPDALIVRGTSGIEGPVRLAAHILAARGCFLLDPLERFASTASDKLDSTATRYERGIGSRSIIAFGADGGEAAIRQLAGEESCPLIFKPIDGKQGAGIWRTASLDEAIATLKKFLDEQPGKPVLIQVDEEFVAEWRVLKVGDSILGSVRKDPSEPRRPANAAQGATFHSEARDDVLDLVTSTGVSGFVGFDVGLTPEGKLRVIEENYAPQWRTFQQATGVNVARAVMDQIHSRIVHR